MMTPRLVVDLVLQEHLLHRRVLILPRIERVLCLMSVVYQRLQEPTPSFYRHFQMASSREAQTPIGVMVSQKHVAAFVRTEEAKGQDGRE
jgi:hypothetical protein